MKRQMNGTYFVILAASLCSIVHAQSDDQPSHGRPFFMPASERQRIQTLIEKEAWAKDEHERLKKSAQRNGYDAAFLYALDGDRSHLPIAKAYLLKYGRSGGDLGPNRRKNLADPEFFKAGQPWLGDVYYRLDIKPMVAYDWVYSALADEERKTIEEGILASARFRMRAMDRWSQTPNLMFKPTFMVAFAGLVTQDKKAIEWGFHRRPGSSQGGYFSVLDVMLRGGGPWGEAPIYPIAHQDLWAMSVMSRYRQLYDGNDWFAHKMPHGGSPQGLLDYYLDTAYPIERTGHGRGQLRIATYGDGATGPGRHDLFLVNPAGRGLSGEKALIAAFDASGDPKYAPFVSMIDGYQPDLWNRCPLPAKSEFPPAPSRVWPEYGLAMLRSDESPGYWTNENAMAVFQVMSQGYGHDHRDKFAIMLHGAGRLLYPDYNAIQYENPTIGWTRNSVSHNTVIVDEQDTANATPTDIRHDFSPDVKFLATSARGVFEGVDQTRALLLTGEYLLDLFQLSSDLPHTYDYLLHGFGEARPLQASGFKPSDAMVKRFWLIDDWRGRRTDDAWALDFTQQDESGSLGGNYGDPWYDHRASVRVTMASAPDTLVSYGRWGEQLAQLVSQRSKGKRQLDQLSAVAVRRAQCYETVFVAAHEPYANDQEPVISDATVLAKTSEAILVRVESSRFTDYAAVSFGATKQEQVLGNGDVALRFRSYGYVRLTHKGNAIARGEISGLRLPGAKGPMTLTGKKVASKRIGNVLTFGELEAVKTPERKRQTPEYRLPVTIAPEVVRGFPNNRRHVQFQIKNTLNQTVSGRLEADLPAGFALEPASAKFGPLAPRQSTTVKATIKLGDALGKQALPCRLVLRSDEGSEEEWRTPALPLNVAVGPTLEPIYQHPKPAVYRVHTPYFTVDMDMKHGLIRRLADDDDTVRLDGGPLFTFGDGEKDLLTPETENAFVWARNAPADVQAHAQDRCRWQAMFFGNRMLIRMNPGWTQFERAHFTLPGQWFSPGGKPHWKRIVVVDEGGEESTARPGTQHKVAAAELEFPGGQWNLAFQFKPPQQVKFDGAGMQFSIGSLTGDNWQIGFIRSGELDAFRGKKVKKKEQAKTSDRPVEVRVGTAGDETRSDGGQAIQTAIDEVAAAGGGAVHVEAGRYSLRSTIHLRDNVRLVGQPGKTVLVMNAAKPRARLAKDAKRFARKITLEEPSQYAVGDGLTIWDDKNANGFMVTTATLTENLGGEAFALDTYARFDYEVNHDARVRAAYPIIAGWDVENIVVEDLIVEGNRDKAHSEYIDGCRGGGIYLYQCQNAIVRGCTVRKYHGDGISCQWNSQNVTIEDCVSEDNSGMGIHPGSDSHDGLVRGNICRRNGNCGLFVCVAVNQCRFEENRFLDNRGPGISIGSRSTDNMFLENRIANNEKAGIEFRHDSADQGAHRFPAQRHLE